MCAMETRLCLRRAYLDVYVKGLVPKGDKPLLPSDSCYSCQGNYPDCFYYKSIDDDSPILWVISGLEKPSFTSNKL